MQGPLYTILELERWNVNSTCDFCSNLENKDNKAICQIRTRNKLTEKLVANNCACEICKGKFENDELPKCSKCGRLQNKSRIFNGRFVCRCVEHKESTKEKELPILPYERRQATFYEQQINNLREEKNQLTEEVETHLDALEVAEDWHKRQKQELIDRIKELETEVERLKKQTPQELILIKEINELKI